MALCEAEKTFVLHGVEENFRVDGREREDYRPMELETNIVSHAFGSARLRLANTDVLVAVKIEVDVPYPERPREGKLEFFVDCSANATPDFEGRGGEHLAIEISNSLAAAYRSPEVFDLMKLCILKGRKCWKIFVDILLLECGGNLYDAVSIAVKAALWDTRIPLVKSVTVDGNNIDMDVSEELHDCQKLDVTGAPLMVTVCKIGEQCIVDPNVAEELCSIGAVVIAVSRSKYSTVLQTGSGSLNPQTLLECLQIGQSVVQGAFPRYRTFGYPNIDTPGIPVIIGTQPVKKFDGNEVTKAIFRKMYEYNVPLLVDELPEDVKEIIHKTDEELSSQAIENLQRQLLQNERSASGIKEELTQSVIKL